MAPYIYGARNSIHIIDLAQTVPLLHQALKVVSDTVAKGGRVLFVGTKRQAADGDRRAGRRCAQYFVNSRWLGGTLTNWKTISASISRLRKLDEHARRRRQGPHQERAPDAVARAGQAREGARRHQGHGRRAGPRVRHRHQQGGAGDQGGQPPQDPGHRDPRHQFRSRRRRLPDPGQRRRQPRDPALLRPDRARGDRRHLAQPGRCRRRHRRGRGAGRDALLPERCRRAVEASDPRPSASSCSPRRAARPTISPS